MQVAISIPENEERSSAATPSASSQAASDILVPVTIEVAGISNRADAASSSPPPTVVQGTSDMVACMSTQLQLQPSERQRLCFDEPVRQPDMRSPLPPRSEKTEASSPAAVELPVPTDATTNGSAGDSDSESPTENTFRFEEAFGDNPLLPSSPVLAVKDTVSKSHMPAGDGESAPPLATAANTLHGNEQAGCGAQSYTDAAAAQATSVNTTVSKASATDVPIKALLQDEVPLSTAGVMAVSSSTAVTDPAPYLPLSPTRSLSKPSATDPTAQYSDKSAHLNHVASVAEGLQSSSGAMADAAADPASVAVPKADQAQQFRPEAVDSFVQTTSDAASSQVQPSCPASSMEAQPLQETDTLVPSSPPLANDLGAPANAAAPTPVPVPAVRAQELQSESQEGQESEGYEGVLRSGSPPLPAVPPRIRRLSLTPAGKPEVLQSPAGFRSTSSLPVPAVEARLRRLSDASTAVAEDGVSPSSSSKLVVNQELPSVGKHKQHNRTQAAESVDAPASDRTSTRVPSSVGRQEEENGNRDDPLQPSLTAALPSSPPVPAVAAAMRRASLANSNAGSPAPEETALPSSPPVPAVAAAMRRASLAHSSKGCHAPEETARRHEVALPSSPPLPAVAAAMRRASLAHSIKESPAPEETARQHEAALLPPLPSPGLQSASAPPRVSPLLIHLGLYQSVDSLPV